MWPLSKYNNHYRPGGFPTTVPKQQRLRARFSKLRVHPWLLETLHSLALIKLQRQRPPDRFVCRMLEMVQKWRQRALGESNEMTVVVAHDLARAHRLSGRFLDAKKGFEEVLAVRKEQFAERHLDSLVAQRELLIATCAMKMPPSLWDTPSLAASLEFVGQRPASPADTDPDMYDFSKPDPFGWSFPGLWETQKLVKDMQESVGHDHPETLTAQLWSSALELLEPNDKECGMSTMRDVGSHLGTGAMQWWAVAFSGP